MKVSNEDGITLVELLAAIVIAVFIGVIGMSIFLSGYQVKDRIKIETYLRDEADLIITSLLNELYLLKESEIVSKQFPEDGTANYYVELKENQKTGFIDGKLIVRNNEASFIYDTLRLADGTKLIQDKEHGQFIITLVLEHMETGQQLETTSEVLNIKDLIEEPDSEGERE